jgi:hypothetical protein
VAGNPKAELSEAIGLLVLQFKKGNNMISDAAIEIFKSASIQPRFLTLTQNDVIKLELLAEEVKEILARGVASDNTPEWLKPHANGNGSAK